MAKGIMENAISGDLQLKDKITVDSAGISAHPNDNASTNSIIILKELGIDISSHKAKLLDLNTASKADIILTMTNSHKNAICKEFPDLASKIFTLKEYVANRNLNNSLELYMGEFDISDPYGMPLSTYKQCALEINTAITKLIQLLKNDSF